MKPFILCILSFLLIACTDPKDTKLPKDPAQWEDGLKSSIQQLSEEEKELFTQYIMRMKFSNAFGGADIADNETIGSAIEKQRAWKLLQEKKKAEQEALKAEILRKNDELTAQLNTALVGTYLQKMVETKYVGKELTLFIAFKNTSLKSISGFKAKATFKNVFDETIYTTVLENDDTLPPRKTVQLRYKNTSWLSSGIEKLAETDDSKLSCNIEPTVIIFSDGEKIALIDEK